MKLSEIHTPWPQLTKEEQLARVHKLRVSRTCRAGQKASLEEEKKEEENEE